MVSIPTKYVPSIRQIIEWHQETYMPDMMFDIPLNRVLKKFFSKNLVDGMVQIEEKELYYIDECVSNATTSIAECGVEESIVWEIYDWVRAERTKV